MRRLTAVFIFLTVVITIRAQQRSAKRGIGWAERNVESRLSDAAIEKMAPGISWVYTWGTTPKGATTLLATGAEGGMDFAPMCWNGNYDADAIRNYVKNHPGVKYLLGFNEPNFSAQANMTPAAAAGKWPAMEALAKELGLKLVAPALNFTGERVGGRIWTPYEWLDEFIKQYKTKYGKLPHTDCLALHCYMDWYSATTWFAMNYFYIDLFDPQNESYGKYPNLVDLLESHRKTNGHFPRMMLTEFCAWEENCTSVDFQIDQMTQKLQKFEQSDLIEGYAWFMANPESNDGKPWMGCFIDGKRNDSELSDLGKIYVHLSSFDTQKFYVPGELIQAKDYVNATTDSRQVKIRPNTEQGSDLPLQIELPSTGYTVYQIHVPVEGEHKITVRTKTFGGLDFRLYVDNKKTSTAPLPNTYGQWQDVEFSATLPEGNHSIMLFNGNGGPVYINAWKFESTTDGASSVKTDSNDRLTAYSLDGIKLNSGKSMQEMRLAKGIYIVERPDGQKRKTAIK